MTRPELFDTVELLVDLPEHNLRAGVRGAIVHQYSDKEFEVELINEDGETIALCALPTAQFIVVWRHATQSWVPLEEQVAELVARLGEPAGREVWDFARFLHWRSQQGESRTSDVLVPA